MPYGRSGEGYVTSARQGSAIESGTTRVELTIPGRPEYVVVVRLAAAAVAGRMGFSYDDIEDLKVAVGEACSAAILTVPPQVAVAFLVAPDRLEVQIVHRPTKAASPRETELNRVLMQVLMDELDTRADGGDHVTRMVKRVPR